MSLQGYFRILFLYDVAEAVQLEALRSTLGAKPIEPAPRFTHPTPDYVRFERPPVVDPLEPINLDTGEQIEGRAKYYDYGVVSVELELGFKCDWGFLLRSSSRWIELPEFKRRADELLRRALDRSAPALIKPYDSWLSEDYYIIQLSEVTTPDGRMLPVSELLASYPREVAQLIRGESSPLSEAELREVLQSSISYASTDLLVVGWTGALVYDSLEGAEATIQLLEYTNTQLLEFRHYDNLLTRLLEDVYSLLEHKPGVLSAWRLSREAARLNTIRLDVMELTEKTDNAIKFLSDMFYARLYRLAAAKVGVPDYRNLVEQKLRTAGELYKFMVDQYYQTRSFILELAVVVILIIDLIFLFRGK